MFFNLARQFWMESGIRKSVRKWMVTTSKPDVLNEIGSVGKLAT